MSDSDLDSEDFVNLRKSLKATREALDRNNEAVERLIEVVERSIEAQRAFTDTFEDALALLEQLMPVIEGLAAGNSAVKMVFPLLKSLLAKRAGRKAKS